MPGMDLIYFIAVFVLGTIIGSFLNVLIRRFNTGMSLGGRSQCFSCGKNLSWYELIPILSFLIQRGKCSSCHSKISWQYLIVEAITGLVFVFTFLKFFPVLELGVEWSVEFKYAILNTLYYILIFSLLIVISVYDFFHKIIPDFFVYLFNIVAFAGIFIFSFSEPRLTMFLAGAALFSFFAILWLMSKGRWMGFGDAKLALGIGFLLGMSQGVTAMIISFWTGAFLGIILIGLSHFSRLFLGGKYLTLKSEIPFGPFMAASTFLVFMLDWNLDKILLLFT